MTRKMKDSGIEWIGEIPEDWEISKFKNSSNLYVGDSIKDNEKDNYLDKDDAKAYVATKDLIIDENMVDFSNTLYVKNDNLKFKTAPKGSSLICIEGGSAGRKKAFLDRDVCFVNKLCCINPLNSMDKKYMFYLISNQAFEQEFDKYIQGLIGGVSINKLSNFNIPLPTLKEQHKVSSFLDNEVNKINISIGYIYEQIENLKNYKKSAITEAVTKGLDKNVEMKDSGIEWIGEIPKHWSVTYLKSFFDEGKNKNKLGGETNLLSLSYGEIIKKDINTQTGLLPKNFNNYNIVEEGSIIIRPTDLQNDKKSLRTGLVNERGIITSAYINLKPKKNVASKYFHYLLHCYDLMKVFYNMGSGVRQGLIYSEFSKLLVLSPNSLEQEQIISYLDRKTKLIDDSIAIKQKQLETLEEYKKSLIYEYVTGKKEVNDGEET